ncbi:Ig-like domain-containing protein [Persicirhabdus sediminis]|uniref:Uncharacterized protein n=1 Tax=Persicirhabdus sediminis TaxID=454144 RepID=A0A8J7SIU3_9BACT|nr:Ig-like domain-containing protein [Persicirhabdus sediminis]MBK1791685.1 hypothetical protein [Persicirhabdus sediminis]
MYQQKPRTSTANKIVYTALFLVFCAVGYVERDSIAGIFGFPPITNSQPEEEVADDAQAADTQIAENETSGDASGKKVTIIQGRSLRPEADDSELSARLSNAAHWQAEDDGEITEATLGNEKKDYTGIADTKTIDAVDFDETPPAPSDEIIQPAVISGPGSANFSLRHDGVLHIAAATTQAYFPQANGIQGIESKLDPKNGSLTINPQQLSINYQPQSGFSGIDNFEVTVNFQQSSENFKVNVFVRDNTPQPVITGKTAFEENFDGDNWTKSLAKKKSTRLVQGEESGELPITPWLWGGSSRTSSVNCITYNDSKQVFSSATTGNNLCIAGRTWVAVPVNLKAGKSYQISLDHGAEKASSKTHVILWDGKPDATLVDSNPDFGKAIFHSYFFNEKAEERHSKFQTPAIYFRNQPYLIFGHYEANASNRIHIDNIKIEEITNREPLTAQQIAAKPAQDTIPASWPFSSDKPAEIVAAARIAGAYAAASPQGNYAVEIRDIRGQMIQSFTRDELAKAAGVSLSSSSSGPSALAFTASGRQLFISVQGDNGKGAVVSFNINTKKTERFLSNIALNTSGSFQKTALAHQAGILYLSTAQGEIINYKADRNDKTGKQLSKVTLPAQEPSKMVTSMAVDDIDGILYLSTAETLYAAPCQKDLKLYKFYSIKNIQSISFTRSYGNDNKEGLFILQRAGDRAALLHLPATSLRARQPVANYYAVVTQPWIDIAATSGGKILTASSDSPLSMTSDRYDQKMDFEEWLRDEFNQYIVLAKNNLWPGDTPEGWVNSACGTMYFGIKGHTGSAGWQSLMFILDEEINGATDTEEIIEKIITRYAGLHPDGLKPKLIEGHLLYDYNIKTGDGGRDFSDIYEMIKFMRAAVYAKHRYPDNKVIAAGIDKVNRDIKNVAERIREYGIVTMSNDQHGPKFSDWNRPRRSGPNYQESYMYAEMAAAIDHTSTQPYVDFLHDVDKVPHGSEYLKGEPTIHWGHPMFVPTYGHIIFRNYRQSPKWRQDFINFCMGFSAWSDDQAPHYLGAFSAGNFGDGFEASSLRKTTNTLTHFPSLLARGIYSDAVAVAGAYMAYREDKRDHMYSFSDKPGAHMLGRHSNEKLIWSHSRWGMVDVHFGAHGLAELIQPGIIDSAIANNLYRELEINKNTDGSVTLNFSDMRPQRVLASTDGRAWDSYGAQLTPFTIPAGNNYKHFRTIPAEGSPLYLANGDFSEKLSHWKPFRNATAKVAHSASLAGGVATVTSNNRGAVYQTVDVSNQFEGTEYKVRAITSSTRGKPSAGKLFVIWDKDDKLGTGTISNAESKVINQGVSIAELEVATSKPAGANYMHVCLFPNGTSSFAAVSAVRMGALVPAENPSFESGKLTGWKTDKASEVTIKVVKDSKAYHGDHALKMSINKKAKRPEATVSQRFDVSADPISTRYRARVRVTGLQMENADAYINASFREKTSDDKPSRTSYGQTVRNQTRDEYIYITFRKREDTEKILDITLTTAGVRSRDAGSPAAEILFDDFQLLRMTP